MIDDTVPQPPVEKRGRAGNWLTIAIAIMILLATGVAYLYYDLRQHNRRAAAQCQETLHGNKIAITCKS